MKLNLEFEELAIAIVAKEVIPTFFTAKFLKESRIIPKDWEFAQPPEIDAESAKATFTNNVIISVYLDTITFSEKLEEKTLFEPKILGIINKWVKTLPKLDYRAIEFNPSSFFTFEEPDKNANFSYIVNALMLPGPWQQVSEQPLTSSLSLAFALKHGQFNLKIDDVRLRRADNSPQSGVLFYGNFPYFNTGNTAKEKADYLCQVLQCWSENLEIYRDIVNKRFLSFNKN